MTWKAKLQTLLHKSTPQKLGSTASTVTANSASEKVAIDRTLHGSPSSESTISGVPGIPVLKEPNWTRRYTVIRKLGEGGMGKVFLAERRSDSLLVCLKFLSASVGDHRAAEQECRALMRLRHPSIVSLLDFSIEDEPPWLAMEYATGSTLEVYLEKHAPLSPRTSMDILRQVLGALDYAHHQGVIHRDLKPANLIIDIAESRLSVRILDFGIAIVDGYDCKGNETGEGCLAGTIYYMAPEQLRGQVVTSSCDVYAVGLITWEMLMGRAAYQHRENLVGLINEKTTRADGFRLEGATVPIPPALDELIGRCTRLDRGARPTAYEALAVLDALGP